MAGWRGGIRGELTSVKSLAFLGLRGRQCTSSCSSACLWGLATGTAELDWVRLRIGFDLIDRSHPGLRIGLDLIDPSHPGPTHTFENHASVAGGSWLRAGLCLFHSRIPHG